MSDEISNVPQPFKPVEISATEFEDLETKALDALCEQFRNRQNDYVSSETLMVLVGTDNDKVASRLFKRLKGIGAVIERPSAFGRHAGVGVHRPTYTVSPRIFEIAAQRKEDVKHAREPEDRVAFVERWIRSHSYWSVAIILFLVLTAVLTFVNQVIQLYDRFKK
jgi:hypothetical protein